MKNLIVITGSALLLFVFVACSKHRAKKLAGTYHCQVSSRHYQMGAGTTDSTYFEDVKVARKGRELSVMNATFDVEEVENEKQFQIGSMDNSMYVVFKEDSLIIRRYSGGMGDNVTLVYKGVK